MCRTRVPRREDDGGAVRGGTHATGSGGEEVGARPRNRTRCGRCSGPVRLSAPRTPAAGPAPPTLVRPAPGTGPDVPTRGPAAPPSGATAGLLGPLVQTEEFPDTQGTALTRKRHKNIYIRTTRRKQETLGLNL